MVWENSITWLLAVVSVVLTALGTYLIDRVKLADRLLDPADLAAQPERYAFLRQRTRPTRMLAFGALGVGGASGLAVSRWAPLATLLCAVGVAIYAFKPRSRWPRPKDILWLKNLYVAAGITTFTALAALAAISTTDSPLAWIKLAQAHLGAVICAASFVLVRVWIDAALCDIDDEITDRRFGTTTAATLLGGSRVRQLANFVSLGLCLILLFIPALPLHARVRWAVAGLIGTISTSLIRPTHLRDFIDMRLPIEALACLILATFT